MLIYDIRPTWTYNQLKNIVKEYLNCGLDLEREQKDNIKSGFIIYKHKKKFITKSTNKHTL